MAAVLGSVLGLVGLVLGKPLFWKLACFLAIFWMPATLILSAGVHIPLMLLSDICMEGEDVGIQFADAYKPAEGGSVLLFNGSVINDALDKMANETGFNFTGPPT